MNTLSTPHPAVRWLLALMLMVGAGLALAQPAEPTLNQVYDAARAGRLEQAQTMMKQVLAAHPNSAKAHFVEAELLAQQGRLDAARQSLARAEQLQPGLPFATPESVSGLRARLTGGGLNGLSGVGGRTSSGVPATNPSSSSSSSSTSRPAPTPSGTSGMSFGFFWPLLLIVGGIALFLMFRRRAAASRANVNGGGAMAQGYPGNTYPGTPVPAGATPYGQAPVPGQPYGQPYAQPQQPGWGSRIAGGLATGAAVGAGMMAAEAIARNMRGGDHGNTQNASNDSLGGSNVGGPIAAGDLGGDNFGIRDTGGWDDSSAFSGSSDAGGGGGGDWDN